ncbi:MAG: hypothetical protein EZS28_039703 [Streblomastix strix]|uniref:Uncharacterized protein n=1 Tax=Streblomastix strix TaxID=222440 RepID=A0A5J4U3S5_9EUKA|nr:MAG: hypothetical protein EZS28_039703 [Streblomastix strix]
MKTVGEKNIKKKSVNILSILIANGINSPSSEASIEKESKIQQLEESNRLKDEQLRQKDEQLRTQQEQIRASDERARLSERQKLQVYEQLRTKDAEIQRLQTEINQLRQIQDPSLATHSTQVIQPVVDRNATLEDNKSELENPDPTGQGLRLERIQDLNRKAVAIKEDALSISLNKVIKDGIHRIEVRFDKCNYDKYSRGSVGIVKAGYKIPYPCDLSNSKMNLMKILYINEIL